MSEATSERRGWDDLPPKPWAEAVEPRAEELADWLTSLDRDQLVWVLARQRVTWRTESNCFLGNHEGQIRDLTDRLMQITDVLTKHGILPGGKVSSPLQEAADHERQNPPDESRQMGAS